MTYANLAIPLYKVPMQVTSAIRAAKIDRFSLLFIFHVVRLCDAYILDV